MGLGKLLRIVGAVNEGVSWISAGLDSVSAWQGLTQFKKQFPDDYRYLDELGNIALNSKFDFKLSPSFPGYVASTWLKSWTSAVKLPTVMLLDPIQKTVEVNYAPVEAIFVQRDERVMWLLNWINEQLTVGRLQVKCTTKSLIRSDLMQLAYHQTLHYPYLTIDQFRILVGNMLSQVSGFYTRFVPVIQALADQKLEINQTGELVGANGKAAEARFAEATRQLASNTSASASDKLAHDLELWLQGQEIQYRRLSGKPIFQLIMSEGQTAYVTIQLYTDTLGNVAFQFRPGWVIIEDLRSEVVRSAYMAFANWGLADCGHYYMEPTTGQMVYRAAIDWRGLEGDGIPAAVLTVLFKVFTRAAIRLDDFRRVGKYEEAPSKSSVPGFRFVRKQSLNELAVDISATAMINMEPQLREDYLVKAGIFSREFTGVFDELEDKFTGNAAGQPAVALRPDQQIGIITTTAETDVSQKPDVTSVRDRGTKTQQPVSESRSPEPSAASASGVSVCKRSGTVQANVQVAQAPTDHGTTIWIVQPKGLAREAAGSLGVFRCPWCDKPYRVSMQPAHLELYCLACGQGIAIDIE